MNQNSSYVVPTYPQLNKENTQNMQIPPRQHMTMPNKGQIETKQMLFYSSFCKNCNVLLNELSKKGILEKVDLISIDNRFVKENIVYINLSNNTQMPLPPMINEVPSLCLLPNYEILKGGDIYNYFVPLTKNINEERNKLNTEPDPFCLDNETIGSHGVSSDNFSFWDTTHEELSASGNGGERQMYNYASISQPSQTIQLEQEGPKESKISMSLEQLQQQRNAEI